MKVKYENEQKKLHRSFSSENCMSLFVHCSAVKLIAFNGNNKISWDMEYSILRDLTACRSFVASKLNFCVQSLHLSHRLIKSRLSSPSRRDALTIVSIFSMFFSQNHTCSFFFTLSAPTSSSNRCYLNSSFERHRVLVCNKLSFGEIQM